MAMEDASITKSVQKALSILQQFAATGKNELSITEFSENLNIPKSTVCRLVKTLQNNSCLAQNPFNGKYCLGLRFFELGNQVPHIKEIRDVSYFHTEQLRHATGSSVHLAVLDQREVVFIEKVQAKAAAELTSSVGKRAPAYCTSVGKVLLAYQPPQRVDYFFKNVKLQRFTPRTICGLDRLQKELAEVRERGYAVDNCEYQDLCLCVGYPIRQHNGSVVAALSISQITSIINDEKIQNLSKLAMITAANISRELGFEKSIEDTMAGLSSNKKEGGG